MTIGIKSSDPSRLDYDQIPGEDKTQPEASADNAYCAEYALPNEPSLLDYVMYPYRFDVFN
jgi:hypothetical protein